MAGTGKRNAQKPLVIDPFAYPNGNGHRRRNESSSNDARFHHHVFFSISAIITISAAILIFIGIIVIILLNSSARRRLAFLETVLECICTTSSRKSASLAVRKLIMFDSNSSDNPNTILNKPAEIGEGVFRTVYKVSLSAPQASTVAVKKLVACGGDIEAYQNTSSTESRHILTIQQKIDY